MMTLEGQSMCMLCDSARTDADLARRAYVLQLLALVEHPDALPADGALRLGREIMALIRLQPALRRCDAIAPPEPAIDETR
jgi:hypothetical protein